MGILGISFTGAHDGPGDGATGIVAEATGRRPTV